MADPLPGQNRMKLVKIIKNNTFYSLKPKGMPKIEMRSLEMIHQIWVRTAGTCGISARNAAVRCRSPITVKKGGTPPWEGKLRRPEAPIPSNFCSSSGGVTQGAPSPSSKTVHQRLCPEEKQDIRTCNPTALPEVFCETGYAGKQLDF